MLIVSWRRLHSAKSLSVVLLLVFSACRKLPEVPRVDATRFGAGVRTQVETEYKAAVQAPNEVFAVGRYCMTLHVYGLADAALVCYERARGLDGGSARWPYYRGLLLREKHSEKEAVQEFRNALSRDQKIAAIHLNLARSLSDAGDRAGSVAEYRSVLRLQPDSAHANLELGRLLDQQGQPQEALDLLLKARDLAPAYPPISHAVFQSYRRLGRTDQAKAEILRSQGLESEPPPMFDPLLEDLLSRDRSTQGYLKRSMGLERAGRLEDAVRELEAALEYDPGNANVHTNLVALYGRAGDYTTAEKHYLLASGKGADPPPLAKFYYANVMAARSRYGEAIRLLQGISLPPAEDVAAKVLLGDLLTVSGRVDAGEVSYRKAVGMQPANPLANLGLGKSLLRQGRRREAIHFLQRALDRDDAVQVDARLLLAKALLQEQRNDELKRILEEAAGMIYRQGTMKQVEEFESIRRSLGPVSR